MINTVPEHVHLDVCIKCEIVYLKFKFIFPYTFSFYESTDIKIKNVNVHLEEGFTYLRPMYLQIKK